MMQAWEREMRDRVERYQREAALRRQLPAPAVRTRVAESLRRFADRLDSRSAPPPALPSLAERNH